MTSGRFLIVLYLVLFSGMYVFESNWPHGSVGWRSGDEEQGRGTFDF